MLVLGEPVVLIETEIDAPILSDDHLLLCAPLNVVVNVVHCFVLDFLVELYVVLATVRRN